MPTNNNIAPPLMPHGELLKYEGNWTEDLPHENGNYTNICTSCKKEFLGYKRRLFCKICAKADIIIVGDRRVGKAHALASLKNCAAELITYSVKQVH